MIGERVLAIFLIYFFVILSSTAAATFRQAVALIFDHVIHGEELPAGRFGSGGYISRTNSVTSDVNRNINRLEYVDSFFDFTAKCQSSL